MNASRTRGIPDKPDEGETVMDRADMLDATMILASASGMPGGA